MYLGTEMYQKTGENKSKQKNNWHDNIRDDKTESEVRYSNDGRFN